MRSMERRPWNGMAAIRAALSRQSSDFRREGSRVLGGPPLIKTIYLTTFN